MKRSVATSVSDERELHFGSVGWEWKEVNVAKIVA